MNNSEFLNGIRIKLSAKIEHLSLDDQLTLAELLRAEIVEKMSIKESKITNGTSGERIVCNYFGLTWSDKKVHGHDGWNSKNEPIEIKIFSHSAQRWNINYGLPKPNSGESFIQFAIRMKEKFETVVGGHYWVEMDKSHTKIVRHWFIPGMKLAEAVYRKLSTLENFPQNLNFGCDKCVDCGGAHRINEISRILNDLNLEPEIPESVPKRCFQKSPV